MSPYVWLYTYSNWVLIKLRSTYPRGRQNWVLVARLLGRRMAFGKLYKYLSGLVEKEVGGLSAPRVLSKANVLFSTHFLLTVSKCSVNCWWSLPHSSAVLGRCWLINFVNFSHLLRSYTRHHHRCRDVYKRVALPPPRQLRFVCVTQFCAIKCASFRHSFCVGAPSLNGLRRARLQNNSLLPISTLLTPTLPSLKCCLTWLICFVSFRSMICHP